MAIFLITYEYTDDAGGREKYRPAHLDFIGELADRGALLISGPLGPTESPGGRIVVEAATKSEALELTVGDPFRINGLVSDATAVEWLPIYGRLAREI